MTSATPSIFLELGWEMIWVDRLACVEYVFAVHYTYSRIDIVHYALDSQSIHYVQTYYFIVRESN